MKAGRRSKLVLLALGTLLTLLALEGVIRLLGLAPQLAAIEIDTPHAAFVSSPNPRLGYVPKPGAGDINADGFRDRPYERRKPADTLRIAVLGDSIGFGYCNESRTIPLEATFAGALERLLNESGDGRTYEVLNFSVSGYDTVQEVEFLEYKALAYDPDLVLLAYCLNDIKVSSTELHLFSRDADWNAYRRTADAAYRNAILRSHLVRFVWHRIPGLADGLGAEEQTPRDPLGGTRPGFERLKVLADGSGFDVSVVVFPFFRDFESYPFPHMHDAVADEARRHGFDVLDLLPVYREASRSADLCSPCCDLHPNETGHLVTARAIAAHLDSRLAARP